MTILFRDLLTFKGTKRGQNLRTLGFQVTFYKIPILNVPEYWVRMELG